MSHNFKPEVYRSNTPSKLNSESSSKAIRRIQEAYEQSATQIAGKTNLTRGAIAGVGEIHRTANDVFTQTSDYINRDRQGQNARQQAASDGFNSAQTTALGNQVLGMTYLGSEKIADVLDESLKPPESKGRFRR